MSVDPDLPVASGPEPKAGPSSLRGEPVRAVDGAAGLRGAGAPLDVRWASFAVVALLATGLAGWLYMAQATKVAEQAHQVLLLEQTKQALEQRVVHLEAEAARLTALQRLRDEASQLNYTLPSAADAQARLYVAAPERGGHQVAAPTTGGTGAGVDVWRAMVSALGRIGSWLGRLASW